MNGPSENIVISAIAFAPSLFSRVLWVRSKPSDLPSRVEAEIHWAQTYVDQFIEIGKLARNLAADNL